MGVASGIIRRRRRPGRPRHSRRERPKIERKFAEGNQRYGLKKARYWGLVKVSIQSDTLGVKTTDFELSEERKTDLLKSGRDCTEAYLRWYEDLRNHPANRP
ncbi:MAG: hypothetical protein ACLFUU_05240 [Desulfobacteraceae bacterium]